MISAYCCWNCGEESPKGKDRHEAEVLAFNVGWKIGHLDGQANISCPGCAVGLWEPIPIYPTEPIAKIEEVVR